MSTDSREAGTPASPASVATAQPDATPPGGGSEAVASIPAFDRADEPVPSDPRAGATGGAAGAAPERLRPRPEIEQILAAAAGGEDRIPSFAEMVRHNATLTRDLGRAQRTIGVLTVERDALGRRLEEIRHEAANPVPAPSQSGDAGRGRWTLAVALLALLALLLVAGWVFGWSVGDLPWSGGSSPSPVPTPGG